MQKEMKKLLTCPKQKKKIENELIAQTKNIEEFTKEIKVNIKKKFIELFNNC